MSLLIDCEAQGTNYQWNFYSYWYYNSGSASTMPYISFREPVQQINPSQDDELDEFHIGDRVKIIRELDKDQTIKHLGEIGQIIKIDYKTKPEFPFWVQLDNPAIIGNQNVGCRRFEIEKIIELKGGDENK